MLPSHQANHLQLRSGHRTKPIAIRMFRKIPFYSSRSSILLSFAICIFVILLHLIAEGHSQQQHSYSYRINHAPSAQSFAEFSIGGQSPLSSPPLSSPPLSSSSSRLAKSFFRSSSRIIGNQNTARIVRRKHIPSSEYYDTPKSFAHRSAKDSNYPQSSSSLSSSFSSSSTTLSQRFDRLCARADRPKGFYVGSYRRSSGSERCYTVCADRRYLRRPFFYCCPPHYRFDYHLRLCAFNSDSVPVSDISVPPFSGNRVTTTTDTTRKPTYYRQSFPLSSSSSSSSLLPQANEQQQPITGYEYRRRPQPQIGTTKTTATTAMQMGKCEPGRRYKAHPTKCDEFLQCFFDTTYIAQRCPPNLWWNDDSGYCDNWENSWCAKLENDKQNNLDSIYNNQNAIASSAAAIPEANDSSTNNNNNHNNNFHGNSDDWGTRIRPNYSSDGKFFYNQNLYIKNKEKFVPQYQSSTPQILLPSSSSTKTSPSQPALQKKTLFGKSNIRCQNKWQANFYRRKYGIECFKSNVMENDVLGVKGGKPIFGERKRKPFWQQRYQPATKGGDENRQGIKSGGHYGVKYRPPSKNRRPIAKPNKSTTEITSTTTRTTTATTTTTKKPTTEMTTTELDEIEPAKKKYITVTMNPTIVTETIKTTSIKPTTPQQSPQTENKNQPNYGDRLNTPISSKTTTTTKVGTTNIMMTTVKEPLITQQVINGQEEEEKENNDNDKNDIPNRPTTPMIEIATKPTVITTALAAATTIPPITTATAIFAETTPTTTITATPTTTTSTPTPTTTTEMTRLLPTFQPLINQTESSSSAVNETSTFKLVLEDNARCVNIGHRYSDDTDCACYYECLLNGRVSHMCCPDGLFFNPSTETRLGETASLVSTNMFGVPDDESETDMPVCDLPENVSCRSIIQ